MSSKRQAHLIINTRAYHFLAKKTEKNNRKRQVGRVMRNMGTGLYLDADRVEDRVVDGGDVEVEHTKPEALQPGHQLEQLPWPLLGENLHVGVALHHRHLYVRHRPLGVVVVDAAAVLQGRVRLGRPAALGRR